MTGFPLLRLPFIPLKSVLDNMYLEELIRLHLCSEKTRELMKATKKAVKFNTLSLKQKQKLNILEILDLLRLETYSNPRGSIGCFPEKSITMTIIVSADYGIEVKINWEYCLANKYQSCFPLLFRVERINQKRLFKGARGNFSINGNNVPVVMRDEHPIHTFWKDKSNGLNVLIEYFKKLFNIKTIKCSICGNMGTKFSQNLKTAAKGMARQTITNCFISTGIMKHGDYKFIFEKIRPTIRFHQIYSINSMLNRFRHKTRFSTEYFELQPSNWFKLGNLINTDCENITLWKSKMTNNDMYEYLKLWMAGRISKLKTLSVQLQEVVNLDFMYSKLKRCSKRYTIVQSLENIYIKKQDTIVARITNDNGKKSIFEFTVFGFN